MSVFAANALSIFVCTEFCATFSTEIVASRKLQVILRGFCCFFVLQKFWVILDEFVQREKKGTDLQYIIEIMTDYYPMRFCLKAFCSKQI